MATIKVVYVEWLDADGKADTWIFHEDLAEYCKSRTVPISAGLLIYEDDEVIVLTQAHTPIQVGACEKIPKTFIRKLEILKDTGVEAPVIE